MIIHSFNRKRPRPGTITSVSTDDSSESLIAESKITHYNGDLLLPIYSTKQIVLSPLEVIRLLNNVGESVSNELVCTCQPLRIEHNRTLIVDLEALKSSEDIKCDDVGRWRNNSCNKYYFQKHDNDWIQQENRDFCTEDDIVTLKRAYFKLQDDVKFRRRIDTVFCKCIVL